MKPRWTSTRARLFAYALGINPDTGQQIERKHVGTLEDAYALIVKEQAYDEWQPIATADKYGPPLRLYAKELIDEDFNPSGSVEGCWQDDVGWMGAVWNAEHDVWDTVVINPTHWMHHPPPPVE